MVYVGGGCVEALCVPARVKMAFGESVLLGVGCSELREDGGAIQLPRTNDAKVGRQKHAKNGQCKGKF